jgi:hypothetical protein
LKFIKENGAFNEDELGMTFSIQEYDENGEESIHFL